MRGSLHSSLAVPGVPNARRIRPWSIRRRHVAGASPSRSNGRIVRGNIIANLANQANALVISAISVAIYIRVMGGDGYGLWLAILGIMSLGTMADLGIQYAVTQVVAELRGENRPDEIQDVVTSGFWAILTASIAITAVIPWIIFTTHPFANVLRQLHLSQSLIYWLVTIGVASMVAQQAPMVLFAAEFGSERFGTVRIIQAATGWVQLGGVVFLTIVLGGRIVELLEWFIALQLVSSLAGVAVVARRGRWHVGGIRSCSTTRLRTLAYKGVAFFGTTIANGARTGIDPLVISIVLGTSYAAKYGPNMRIFTVGAIIVPIVFESLWPTITRMAQGTERKWIDHAFRLGATVVLGVGTCISVCMIVLGRPLLEAWVGKAGFPGTAVVDTLTIWFIVNLWVQITAYVLISLGKTVMVMCWTLAEGVVNIALSVVLMHHIGLLGSAIGSLSAGFCMAAVPLTLAFRLLERGGVNVPLRLLIGTPVTISAVSAVALVVKQVMTPISDLMTSVLFGIIILMVTAGAFISIAMTSGDRMRVMFEVRRLVSSGAGRNS